MAYHRVFLAMVIYSLTMTTMTEQDMENIQTTMDKIYKTKMHLNRHYSNAVYRGIERCGEPNISTLTTHQG